MINSSQKDVEVFCVALPMVTYKLTIICEIDGLSAKYVNLEKNLIIRRFGLSPFVRYGTFVLAFRSCLERQR